LSSVSHRPEEGWRKRQLSERGWGDEAAYFADPDGNVVAVGMRLD
jgi:hypothetical protein